MMVQARVIVLIAVLLLPCVPFAPAEETTSGQFSFNHAHGEVHTSGVFELTGTSTIPLNSVTWQLIDASTGIVLFDGSYLDKVTPSGDAMWTWSHNLSVVDAGCSCRFVVDFGVDHVQPSELVVFFGSAFAWAPVWLSQPLDDVVFTDSGNRSFELPVVFPPDRANGSVVEMERCPSSSGGVCKSPASLLSADLTQDGSSTFVELVPQEWMPEGHWSVTSVTVVDSVLSRSASLSWHVLHDKTAPEVSIESASSANESDRVLVVVNATDATSELVSLVDLRATSPNGAVTVLDALANSSEFTLQPEVAGTWDIVATVRDGAGLTQTAHHALNVVNLPPVAGLRLNGAVLENGDVLQVKLGQPLVLDASTSSDTPSDMLRLNHVWWIGEDLRLSGVEQLTGERFQETGTFEVRLEVVDDDGAMTDIAFTLEVVDDAAPLRDAVVVGPLVLAIIGLGFAGLFFVRHRKDRANIPTWPSEPEH